MRAYLAAGEKLRPFVANTVVWLHRALQKDKAILFEGAQGTFLDIDHGTYPYVTSSNTTAGGACTGSGVPPHRMDVVLGGRESLHHPRRRRLAPDGGRGDRGHAACDGPRIRRHHRPAATLRLVRCRRRALRDHDQRDRRARDHESRRSRFRRPDSRLRRYRLKGKRLEVPPSDAAQLENCEPIYESLRGWKTSTHDAKKFKDLPVAARAYVRAPVGARGRARPDCERRAGSTADDSALAR